MSDNKYTKRDLDEDLRICEAATGGPWLHSGGFVVKNVNGDSFEWEADFVAETDAEEDARFIAEAREGWPEAIWRAKRAEKALIFIRDTVRNMPDGTDFDDELERIHTLCTVVIGYE